MSNTIDVFESIGQKLHLERAGKGNTFNQQYMVTGTDDKDEAATAIINAANLTPLILHGLAFVVADSLDLDEVADGTWEGSLDFITPESTNSSQQPKQIGEITFTFDGTGGKILTRHAFEQTKYGANAPDHGKAIDVRDGEAQGVDVVIPALSFSLSQKFEGATITLPWLRQICLATGTVNSDTFCHFEPGEVLFLGPSGSQPFAFLSNGTVAKGEREVEFRFAVSPNLADLTIGDITGIAKPGHDYLWIESKPVEDAASNAKGITSKPIGVYVAQVYRRLAFSSLGLSDPSTNYPVA